MVWARRHARSLLAGALGLFVLTGAALSFADWYSCLPANAPNRYVGSAACLDCHRDQAAKWHGSHHDLAMQKATDETVLANFNDAEFTHHDISSRMFRRDGKFFVNTEGPDGKLADFEVKYVFGVEPLQQYMVEFDRDASQSKDEIARLQVLRLSWNTAEKKWFYLPPPDVAEKLAPDDDLHWTGIAQRWNTMCADCHSTNLKKNYNAATGHYHTTFTDINVGCEACHGPGRLHVQIASSKRLFWDRRHGLGLANLKSDSNLTAVHACAPCHSRRRLLAPDFKPGDSFHDFFAAELLSDSAYHADGQIRDEVYELGSFVQSKMFHKNIRCTDCHDPHSTELLRPGNRLCTECHVNPAAHPAGKYDTPAHHHHQPDKAGASCVECHMPETTYMEIDARRDHQLRAPRPDLSVALGVPNACTRCHLDKADLPAEKRAEFKQYNDWIIAAEHDPEVRAALAKVDAWAAENVQRWYNKQPPLAPHYAAAFQAARRGDPDAEAGLIAVAADPQSSAIVRATAVRLLTGRDTTAAREAAMAALKDPDPQVRAAAVGALETSPRVLVKAVGPLLEDPSRLVRTEAARVLAALAGVLRNNRQRSAFDDALEEYIQSLMMTNDRAGAYVNLGVLYEDLGDEARAEAAYRQAIVVEPRVAGPRSNLADLLERRRDRLIQRAVSATTSDNAASAENSKQSAIVASMEAGDLRQQELALFARDAELAPTNASVQYRYGLSLYLQGRMDDAEKALAAACRLEPQNADFALALALLYQKLERIPAAMEWINKAIELRPEDASYRQLLDELEAAARN